MSTNREIWKTIDGYANYEVSSFATMNTNNNKILSHTITYANIYPASTCRHYLSIFAF
jgi:hypothetical protein